MTPKQSFILDIIACPDRKHGSIVSLRDLLKGGQHGLVVHVIEGNVSREGGCEVEGMVGLDEESLLVGIELECGGGGPP